MPELYEAFEFTGLLCLGSVLFLVSRLVFRIAVV